MLFQGKRLINSFLLSASCGIVLLLSACGGELASEGLDTTAPEITLKGESTMVVTQGETFEDPGVSVTDAVDGEITDVTTTGKVDTSAVSTYSLSYSAVDAAGNAASITRTVRVEKSVAPNDTGLYWGANTPKGINTDCTGQTVSAQDCSTGRDTKAASTLGKTGTGRYGFDFTKLDASGNALAAGATDWFCVKDNHTGLVWEVKKDSGLHNKSDKYNWYSNDGTLNGGAIGFEGIYESGICDGYTSGETDTYCNTQAYVARVNAEGLCGAKDWRLPHREEMRSIIDYGLTKAPLIDANFFPNTQTGLLGVFYWTNSPSALNGASIPGQAWAFYSDDYGLSAIQIVRSVNGHVRLVRSDD